MGEVEAGKDAVELTEENWVSPENLRVLMERFQAILRKYPSPIQQAVPPVGVKVYMSGVHDGGDTSEVGVTEKESDRTESVVVLSEQERRLRLLE